MTAQSFKGFPQAAFSFLGELEKNNERACFQENKARYESDVLAPALQFIAAMEKPLMGVSHHFRATPKRTGGSLMRIYRDTRFAKDKKPYKTNIGIQFRHEYGKDIHAPGYYVHIDPQQAFLGVGMWHPEATALGKIRDAIVEEPKRWRKVVQSKKFAARFALAGDSLKRAPRGYPADHVCIDDLRRKDFIAVRNLRKTEVRSAGFVADVADSFRSAAPFMEFLCRAVEVPY